MSLASGTAAESIPSLNQRLTVRNPIQIGKAVGDAREHFECRGSETWTSVRAILFAHICGQGRVVSSETTPVENPQLKADKAELAVERNQRRN
jgi:hypothetical protein